MSFWVTPTGEKTSCGLIDPPSTDWTPLLLSLKIEKKNLLFLGGGPFSICLIENEREAKPAQRWNAAVSFFVLCHRSSHTLLDIVWLQEKHKPFPPNSHFALWEFFFFSFFYSLFFFLLLLFFPSPKFRHSSECSEKHSFSPMQISACGKYRVAFHPTVPSANQAAVGGERLLFLSLKNHYLLNTLCSVARI